MFGFLEFEDDPEILDALLAAAGDWLRTCGCTEMLDPLDFSLNEEAGVLIEGFDLEPQIHQNWLPPYYQERCQAAGPTMAMDLLSRELSIEDRSQMRPAIERLAERCREKHGIEVGKMTHRYRERRRSERAFALPRRGPISGVGRR